MPVFFSYMPTLYKIKILYRCCLSFFLNAGLMRKPSIACRKLGGWVFTTLLGLLSCLNPAGVRRRQNVAAVGGYRMVCKFTHH